MPSHYYGGAPNAFAGGALFQKDLRRQEHQDNALNALIQRFGPEAGDPIAWGQAQVVDQREQLFPHDLAAAERDTAAFDALAQEHGPIAGNPTAHGIDVAENQELQIAALSAARWLEAAKARGADMGQAYDRVQTILPHLGIPAEGVAAIRQQIISDPDSVDELIAMLSGIPQGGTGRVGVRRAIGNPIEIELEDGSFGFMQSYSDGTREIIDDVTPARAAQAQERLGQGDRRVTLAELQAEGWDAEPGHRIFEDRDTGEWYARVIPGSEASRESEDRSRRISAEESAEVAAAQEQVQIADLALNALENAEGAMDRWGILQGGEGNIARGVRAFQGLPGVRAVTDVGRFQQELKTLQAHVALDRLAAIKATGATLGQITERELALLENSMGNLSDPSRSPDLIRQDLATIREIMTEARQRAQDGLRGVSTTEGGGSSGASGSWDGEGANWQQRARQLQSQGLSQEEILQQLRAEGLIAPAGGGR